MVTALFILIRTLVHLARFFYLLYDGPDENKLRKPFLANVPIRNLRKHLKVFGIFEGIENWALARNELIC